MHGHITRGYFLYGMALTIAGSTLPFTAIGAVAYADSAIGQAQRAVAVTVAG